MPFEFNLSRPLRYGDNADASATWAGIFPYAILTIFMYPIGIFLLFMFLMHLVRGNLESEGAKDTLGFLYIKCRHEWYWYELVQLFRKMCLVAFLILLPDDTVSGTVRKTVFSLTVVLLGILLHFYAQPYKSPGLDKMYAMVIMTEFFTLFSGLIFLSDKMSPSFHRGVEVVNIVVILFTLCAVVARPRVVHSIP